MRTKPFCLGALFAAAALLTASTALAQTTPATPASSPPPTPGFWLTTPFPDTSVGAGDTADLRLTLKNTGLPPQRVALSVGGAPAGWKVALKGNGQDITTAIVNQNDTQDVDLDVTPPATVTSGTYKFTVEAKYGDQSASLPVSLTVAAQQPASIKLEPELPALRGTPTTTFDYRVKVDNNTPKDELFNLAADAPAGFSTTFKHGYDTAEITGVPIKANSSDTITLEVKPNPGVAAGKYPIKLAVQAGNLSAETDLGLEVTGQPTLALSGPGERLSGEAVAGQGTTFPFTVSNTGSAPAQNLKFSANAASGWTVNFDPDSLTSLAPNAQQTVNVKITPSDKAIAGDYVVNLTANADGASQSADFRVTVNTSTIWGMVGLLVIAVAVIIIVLAVLRYGRR